MVSATAGRHDDDVRTQKPAPSLRAVPSLCGPAPFRARIALHVRVQLQIVVHNVGDGLRIGGRAGAAAEDAVVDVGELVGDAVRDVRAGRRP